MKEPTKVIKTCGAKTRTGDPCAKFPIAGKRRCRLHGGLSTGPRTEEGKKKIAEWTGEILMPVEMAIPQGEVKRNFQRNQQLIDLSKAPEEIFMSCLRAYQEAPDGDRSKLLNYFIDKRLNNLTESIGEF